MSKQTITFRGIPQRLSGKKVRVGQPAPDFSLVAFGRGDDGPTFITRDELVSSRYPMLISVISSVDTPVGSQQVKQFNERLRPLHEQSLLLSVSSDLPTNLNRFCETEAIDVLAHCSDYRDRNFGKHWGVLLTDPLVLARAVFVVDHLGVVQYTEVVPEITHEPDYDSPIAVLKDLIPIAQAYRETPH